MCFFHNFFNLFETVNTISCKCVIKEAIVNTISCKRVIKEAIVNTISCKHVIKEAIVNTISCKRVIVNVSLRRLLQILTVNSEKSVDIYNDI